MKKISLLFLILMLGVVTNCSKDDDPTTNPTQTIDKKANLLATGDSANDILSNDNFNKLLIEIAYVQGFRPTQEALDNFVAYLREHTFKQDIELIYNQLPSPSEETLTVTEIASLETDNRTAYNDGKTLAIYIYFADAPSEDDNDSEGVVTLGAVYRNTSMVIYEATVRNLANKSVLITTATVETATLHHEFGHLFGLVDLGTPMVNNHEDPEAENHCTTEGCLMRAELQFGSSRMKMLTAKNNAVPSLDAECKADLQANGGR